MDFGLSSVNTKYELGSIFIPTTIIGRPIHASNWLPPVHDISEATADRVREMKSNNHYNFKSEFESRRDKRVNLDFRRQHDPTSQPTLDSTTLGKNTRKRTTSPIDSIPVGTKTLEPAPLTQPTESPEGKWKISCTRAT